MHIKWRRMFYKLVLHKTRNIEKAEHVEVNLLNRKMIMLKYKSITKSSHSYN